MDFELLNVIVVLYGFVFLWTLIFEDFELILKDLDSFLEFGKVLRGVLDEIDVLVTGGLDFFVKGFEMLEFVLGFLLFFSEIKDEEFLDFELLLSLSYLGVGDRGFTGHGLSDGGWVLDFLVDVVDNFFEFGKGVFHFSDFDFYFFFFALICGGLEFDVLGFVIDNDNVFFHDDCSIEEFLSFWLDESLLFFYFFCDHLSFEDKFLILFFLD